MILISPIAYEDHGKRTPNWERRNGELKAYTRAMNSVASSTGLPFVDLNRLSTDLMEDYKAPKMTGNGVNLNEYGYWSVCRALADNLIAGPKPWRLEVDAGNAKASADGVKIGEVHVVGGGVRFDVSEETWPSLGAPTADPVHRLLEDQQDRLVVKNLPEGVYLLTIDGDAITTADNKRWAGGISISNTPAHQALENYREAIYEKNINFVYGWKALNQVHIVGERRKSNSGRALPAELIEFNNIAKAKETSLANGIELKTREWRLTPVSLLR